MSKELLDAAEALLDDVRKRHPGEALTCPYMRRLDAAVKSSNNSADARLPLAYRVKVAQSHAVWVVGAWGQAYWGGLIKNKEFEHWTNHMRGAFQFAPQNEKTYDNLLLVTATMEEIIADKTKNPPKDSINGKR